MMLTINLTTEELLAIAAAKTFVRHGCLDRDADRIEAAIQAVIERIDPATITESVA